MQTAAPDKAKIAKRVIEVLEFFDERHPQATVMDIVRRFNRPQSSTSELLISLVDLGLLYKDPCSRAYSPTPRAAMLGRAAQPDMVRDGRLIKTIERLSAQTGFGIAVFGMVSVKVQIFSWWPGARPLRTSGRAELCGGQQEFLSDSAAGWLLLSTVAQQRREGMIRRLNAEASNERKFSVTEMTARVARCRERGYSVGVAGFGSGADIAAVLLPDQPEHQPLAMGYIYKPSDEIDPAGLVQSLNDAIEHCIKGQAPASASVQRLLSVA